MPTVDAYSQGTPCWAEILSADVDAARDFYGKLFGWEFEANDMGGMTYYVAKKDGVPVAGLMQQMPVMSDGGLPTGWMTYLAVDDADATAAAVTEAGGTVLFPVDQIPEVAKTVLARDDQGTAIGFWQATGHIGSGVVDEPGAVSWYELQTADVDAAKTFYRAVAGMESRTGPAGDMAAYTEFQVDGKPVAGALPKPMPEMPNYWALYFNVEDADRTVAQILELGGAVVAPAFDVTSIGRLAVMADPQGAVFNIMAH
jgi:uncharacterized protein